MVPDSDAALMWFEVWPVFALLILKITLQCKYFCGPVYDPKKESPYLIREILTDKLAHSSFAAVVESYLPLFHDSKACPAELLAIEVDHPQKSHKKTNGKNGTYERFE